MTIIYSIFFYIIAGVLILSSLGMLLARGIVYSVISLIITFLSVAGIFIMLNADFVGVSQIIIYGVGITIILLFAIMLTNKEADSKLWIAVTPRSLISIIIAMALFGLIFCSITNFHVKRSSPILHSLGSVIKKQGDFNKRGINQFSLLNKRFKFSTIKTILNKNISIHTAENTGIFRIRKPNKETITKLKNEGTSKTIGESLLTTYLLPFELLSILLLAAIIGSVILSKKDEDNLVNPTTIVDRSEVKRGEANL